MSWLKRLRGATDSVPREAAVAPIDGRAAALLSQQRYREARDLLVQLGEQRSLAREEQVTLGWAQLNLGDPVAAIDTFERVVAQEPGNAEALRGAGEAALAQGHDVDAVSLLERALKARTDVAETHRSLGAALIRAGDPPRAEVALQRAIAMNPEDPLAHDLLGMARLQAHGPAAALDAYARAHELETVLDVDGNGSCNYAITLAELGRLNEALDVFETFLATRPDPFGFLTHAMALLRTGDFIRGWRRHEFRWLTREFIPRRPAFPFPEWTGQDLRDKRIALLSEQGFGDVLQFVRYARQLHDMGAHVSVIAHEGLASLLRTVPGVDAVPTEAASLGDPDYFVHLMSLPHRLGTTLASVPDAVPYLHAGEAARERCLDLRRVQGRKVGIVWAGSPTHARDRHRSLPLEVLEPLFKADGVRWFSLQKIHARKDDADLLHRFGIEDLAARLSSFEETAAAIEGLDLVLTVDTSVAHLAGALGKPVWLLLPVFPDFRWMEGRADSPWYPGMRIFRQPRQGDWSAVVREVAIALQGEVVAVTEERTLAPSPRESAPDRFAVVNTEWGMLAHLEEGDEGASLRHYAEWLPLHLQMLRRFLSADACVLEVGAGIGTHSIVIEASLSGHGHLMLLERDLLFRRMLRHNLDGNRLRNHTIFPRESCELSIDALDLDRLAVLKIGAGEPSTALLEGARTTLWRHRPTVVVCQSASGGARAALSDYGYRLFRFDAPLFRPDNFARRHADVFAGRNACWTFALPEEAAEPSVDLAGWAPFD